MQTRGERNNNPGNIRKTSIRWLGEILGNDIGFEKFDTPEHGIRALAKILLTYQDKYRLRTIREIISRWAPRSENNTEAYINFVAQLSALREDDLLDLRISDTMYRLVYAIIKFENGRVSYQLDQVKSAVNMALENR